MSTKLSCEYCQDPQQDTHGTQCCWTRALEIFKFKRRVWHKYIMGSVFDMIISIMSVVTDIIAIVNYVVKEKYGFALLTLIPVLLPTFVFTNVYLRDESQLKHKKKPVSKVASLHQEKAGEPSIDEKSEYSKEDSSSIDESAETSSTDSSIRDLDKGNECCRRCQFHWSCCRRPMKIWRKCFRGCFQCLCHRDLQLRKKGATIVKNSIQKMFKYGFGTFVLRFIAWAWYVKALIFGVKAFKEPKKFLKIELPENHWSHELLVRLDFLQAALENAPQCCVQLYALITQPDEDPVLGLLTLVFSFVDFVRISVSVHWDMNKGPVTAPSGCYDTWIWKLVNTSSWIFIYLARASAIALIVATSGYNSTRTIFPGVVFVLHILILAKVLSKAEYGVAAQKVIVATFISIFFLPELDSFVMPAIVQFYYAMIIFQNAVFIIPWEGFEKEYCVSMGGYGEKQSTMRMPLTRVPPSDWSTTAAIGKITPGPILIPSGARAALTFPTTTPDYPEHSDCLIDPAILTLAVPTLTVIGVIFRLAASQKMVSYKQTLPSNTDERDQTQNKLETSVSNLFNKKWTQMGVNDMLSAFMRMLKKEVVITDESSSVESEGISILGQGKKFSFMSSRLQRDFLASQTFIRESFSLMTRTTRSNDIDFMGSLGQRRKSSGNEDPSDYNSDSELAIRLNKTLKKRPRLPRSRNVSESRTFHGPEQTMNPDKEKVSTQQMELPSGNQILDMCWV